MKIPSQAHIEIAVEWLLNNEGDGEEGHACRVVAAWIEHLSQEALITRGARAAGVTKARFRRKLAELSQ